MISEAVCLEGPALCLSEVSSKEVLVQRQGTPQRPLLKVSVDPVQHQQVKQVARVTSRSFKHPLLDGGWGKIRRPGSMSGSEALIDLRETRTDPAALEEHLPHQSLFWDWGLLRNTKSPPGATCQTKDCNREQWVPASRAEGLSGQECTVSPHESQVSRKALTARISLPFANQGSARCGTSMPGAHIWSWSGLEWKTSSTPS